MSVGRILPELELNLTAVSCAGNLKTHQLIHSGVKAYRFKPYSCHLCGKSFKYPHQLKKHQTNITNMNVHTWKASGISVHTPNTNDPTL
uniref:C2H2-type domain-containing protein n=1 Tax=Astatotilapia calliptera TaxID=8154 RepID=A0AAX7TLF7_ASTCA